MYEVKADDYETDNSDDYKLSDSEGSSMMASRSLSDSGFNDVDMK